MNDSIVFYRSFAEALNELPPEQYKEAMQAILTYGLDGVEMDCEGIAKVIFTLVKPQLDANSKRRENSNKGGRPKSKKPMVLENDENKKPMVSENEEIEKPMVSQNDKNEKPMVLENEKNTKPMVSQKCEIEKPNVNVNANANVNANVNEREKVRARFAPPSLEEVEEYMAEKQGIAFAKKEAGGFVDFYTSNGWKVGKNPMKDWRSAASGWIRRSLDRGTSAPSGGRSEPKKSKFSNFNEREYNMAALERSLVT